MTRSRYIKVRQSIGTQVEVAKQLGIARLTLVRRENGDAKISREAALAILSLPRSDKKAWLCHRVSYEGSKVQIRLHPPSKKELRYMSRVIEVQYAS